MQGAHWSLGEEFDRPPSTVRNYGCRIRVHPCTSESSVVISCPLLSGSSERASSTAYHGSHGCTRIWHGYCTFEGVRGTDRSPPSVLRRWNVAANAVACKGPELASAHLLRDLQPMVPPTPHDADHDATDVVLQHCRHCGAPQPLNSSFCSKCGATSRPVSDLVDPLRDKLQQL
ncbi:MAG: zinc-ribbon domain-containing protein, partial [Gemmatimonadaceae bacterium]